MTRILSAAALPFALLLGTAGLSSPAAAAPAGSYRDSCRDVRDTGTRRDPAISAQCRDERGRYRQTSLSLAGCDNGDIGNNNGRLVCTPASGRPGNGNGNGNGNGWGNGGQNRLPAGSWIQSCRNGDVRRGVLTARCEDTRGRQRETSADVRACPSGRFGNANGRLVCE